MRITQSPRPKMKHGIVFLVFGSVLDFAWSFNTPNCHDNRTVIVHLFNWRHVDVAQECERWLGPKGYCGVQVSPSNEHREYRGNDWYRPWWERYQPISYNLESRSGGEDEFTDMIERCEAVGVRIYVDVVINHVTWIDGSFGYGSGGCYYDTRNLSYPCVPYSSTDFNCCGQLGTGNCADGEVCETDTCEIQDYGEPLQVRNCRLVTLGDLALKLDYPRQRIREYLDYLLTMGVAGFRVDACKHMWPGDLEAIYEGMTLPDGSQPFIFNEVIDLGGEPITGDEYFQLGLVTEFKGCNNLGRSFRGLADLVYLENYGEAWGMYPSENALAFVDNHDNQRGHGAGGEVILSFWEPRPYKMAVIFNMAWDYGFARIMSSYRYPGGQIEGDGYGPPTNDGDDIKDVRIFPDNSCDDGTDWTWLCEHRWRQIANMAQFRNQAGNAPVENWWSNGKNQIAFSRGDRAFLVINNEVDVDLDEILQTGLAAGDYCNVNAANFEDGECTDSAAVITVGADGTAAISIPAGVEDPVVALHVGAQVS